MTTASAVSVAEALMVELRRRGIAAPGVKHKLIVSEWLRLLFEDAQPIDNADLLPDHRAQLLDDVGPHVIEP